MAAYRQLGVANRPNQWLALTAQENAASGSQGRRATLTGARARGRVSWRRGSTTPVVRRRRTGGAIRKNT
jgi:hypothetical protein